MRAISACWKYGKYFVAAWAMLLAWPFMLMGGPAIFGYVLALGVIALAGDLLLGEDFTDYAGTYRYPGLFFWLETASQVIMIGTTLLFLWSLAYPRVDFLGIGAAVSHLTGTDLVARHAGNDWIYYLSSFAITAAGGALVNVAIAHNLIHRTYDLKSVWVGRIGEAFGLFTYFSIRHPYGHHNLVGTPADPAWARRGDSFYGFVVRSIVGQYRMTWALERERLLKIGRPIWGIHNAALLGWALEAAIAVLFWMVAGWVGVLALLGIGLVTHVMLEFANYMEHYGLVRVPSEPFQYRHAWNDNHRMSLWIVAAVPRHSHHHADAQVEHYELKPLPDAPTTLGGYVVTALISLIPPLWHALMSPRLLEWDAHYATSAERRLAADENLRSGIPLLVDAGNQYFSQTSRDDGRTACA